jgi:hypothetical protein
VDVRLLAEAAGTRQPIYHGSTFESEKNPGTMITPAAGIINSPADITLSRYDEFYAKDEATGQTVKTQMWPWLGMDNDEQLMKDTDQDGMPDAYEQSVGLNPNDASDGYRLTNNGYSNLEIFLNGVADGIIDLTPYRYDKTGVIIPKKDSEKNVPTYDLLGQRLAQPHKGISIQNGRKILKQR